MKILSLIAAGLSEGFLMPQSEFGDYPNSLERKSTKNYTQYADWMGAPKTCSPQKGQCMDLEECLLSKHNMEVQSVIRNRGNLIQAKYEIGCMPGYSPNMEGAQTTMVACNRVKGDFTKLNWRVLNSFKCIQTGRRYDHRLGTRTEPECPSAGLDFLVSENFVREDNSATAQWQGPLFDNNGAFIRTRIPTNLIASPSGYEKGFVIFVVYNLKLSDQPAGEGGLRFTMYSSDFDYVTTTEDDESTIVAFKSTIDPADALTTGFNAYYSIEGIQMDETQHESFEIGTMGLGSFETTCEESCKSTDADGAEVIDATCMDNISSCVNDAIIHLATCILPTIDGTPATA